MQGTVKLSCDVLVVGTGAAGCSAAIAAAERTAKVIIVNKGSFGRTGSTCLGSGIYAAGLGHSDNRDSPEQHFFDTIVEGRYIGNQILVKILAEEAPRTVYDLERYGVAWYKRGAKKINPSIYHYLQIPSPPHKYSRGVIHNEKTGRLIQSALCKEVLKHSEGIKIVNDIYIWTLVIQNNRVAGALGTDLHSGRVVVFECKAVVLATGGSGASFKVTDTDTGATGDGCSIAYRAGAELVDMEFVQFYPTAYVHPESIHGIIAAVSSLWSSGLKLYNAEGKRFMAEKFSQYCENLPRDILTQGIFTEISKGKSTPHGGVWLDASDLENWKEVRKEHPRTFMWPKRFGISGRRFEVGPTCHFTMGGIRINEKCGTNIMGLYAAGEIAGGVHGGNRLAGNALCECVVFGQIAGKEASNFRKENFLELKNSCINNEKEKLGVLFKNSKRKGNTHSSRLIRELKDTMYRHVGVVKDSDSLKIARKNINEIKNRACSHLKIEVGKIFNYDQIHAFELFNMIDICDLIITSALMRKETRGAHYRRDYPQTDNKNWCKNIIVKLVDNKPVFQVKKVKPAYIDLPE